MSPIQRFQRVQVGYAERRVLRPGMAVTKVGDVIVRDAQRFRVTFVAWPVLPTEADRRTFRSTLQPGDTIESIEYTPLRRRTREERRPRMRAWADCPVSEELLALGGSDFRHAIREQLWHALQDAAKEAGEVLQPWDRIRYYVDPVERWGWGDDYALAAGLGQHVIRAVVLP